MLGCSVTLEAQSVNIVMDHSQNWMEPSETCFVSCIMTLAYCCVFVQLAVRNLCKYWHGPLYLWECYSLCFHGNTEWTHFHTNFSYFNPLACHLSGSFINFKTGASSSSTNSTNSSHASDEALHAQTTETVAVAVPAADVLTDRFQIQQAAEQELATM